MTLNEFRAWLEGFEASFGDGGGGCIGPTPEQWQAVKAKLATVELLAAPCRPQPPTPTVWPGVRPPNTTLPNRTGAATPEHMVRGHGYAPATQ